MIHSSRSPLLTAYALLVALSVAAEIACGETPSSPSAPPDSRQTLAIVPVLTGLRFGENQRFSAMMITGTSQTSVSPVNWSSDHPDVCVVSQDGSLAAARLGVAQITAT